MAIAKAEQPSTSVAVAKHTRTPLVPRLWKVRMWRLIRRRAWVVAVGGFASSVLSLGLVVGGQPHGIIAFAGCMSVFVFGMALDNLVEKRLERARREVKEARASRAL